MEHTFTYCKYLPYINSGGMETTSEKVQVKINNEYIYMK
jgi:hypothetical protein